MELTDRIRTAPIRHLPPSKPIVVTPDTPVLQAIALMEGARKGCVLVEENGRLSGLATERDILVKFIGQGLPDSTRIDEIMSTNLRTLSPEDTIERVIKVMVEGGYRHVPLTDSDRHILGMVSARHIVAYVSEHFPAEVFNLPPRPDQKIASPEGA